MRMPRTLRRRHTCSRTDHGVCHTTVHLHAAHNVDKKNCTCGAAAFFVPVYTQLRCHCRTLYNPASLAVRAKTTAVGWGNVGAARPGRVVESRGPRAHREGTSFWGLRVTVEEGTQAFTGKTTGPTMNKNNRHARPGMTQNKSHSSLHLRALENAYTVQPCLHAADAALRLLYPPGYTVSITEKLHFSSIDCKKGGKVR